MRGAANLLGGSSGVPLVEGQLGTIDWGIGSSNAHASMQSWGDSERETHTIRQSFSACSSSSRTESR